MMREPVDGGMGARTGRRLGPTAPVLGLVPAPAVRSTCHAKATTGTIRAQLITVSGWRARSARRPTLHLPTAWLWQKAWKQLAAAASSHARVDRLAGTAGAGRVRGAGLRVVALWRSAFPEIRLAAPESVVVGLFLVRPPPSRRCRSLASRRLAWRERPSETA